MNPAQDFRPPPRALRSYYVVYLVLDVSGSMRAVPHGEVESPFERFQVLMPDLVFSLRESTQVRTSCWVSVLAFATVATPVLEAVSLRTMPSVKELPGTGETNYVAALELLRDRIRADRAMLMQSMPGGSDGGVRVSPLVFFVTDGKPWVNQSEQPREVWLAARKEVTDTDLAGRIAAIGMEGSAESVLADLATGDDRRLNAFIAEGSVSATQLADNIIAAIKFSVQRSTQVGKMVIETPPGMRRIGNGP